MIIKFLRQLRHGPLRRFSPAWLFLGNCYRSVFKLLKLSKSAAHNIGPYGPFLLDGYFAFSNFSKWGGGHNNGFEHCIEACRSANCFVDVGAHIGLVTLPAAKMLSGRGHVHAFEPAEINNRFLRRHLSLNCISNVSVSNVLLGERKELVDFFETKYPNGQNSKVETIRSRTYTKCKRDQISLDQYVAEKKISPDIIKIDVEGAEISVLAGARKTIKKFRPLIFLSVHPEELNATTKGVEGLKAIIRKIEYQCFEFDGSEVVEFKLSEYLLKPDKG